MNSWIREIEQATTEAEIVASTRDYVALYSPRELAPVLDCRVIDIGGGADIPRWKQKVADGCARMREAPEHDHLQELVSYLSRAEQRLDEIRSPQ